MKAVNPQATLNYNPKLLAFTFPWNTQTFFFPLEIFVESFKLQLKIFWVSQQQIT